MFFKSVKYEHCITLYINVRVREYRDSPALRWDRFIVYLCDSDVIFAILVMTK